MASRGQWKNWYEFLFSCLGCLVGLGNIWRFPYLCYKNGGGAFLVPYFLFMFLCAFPVFFIEMSFAQFSNLGPGKMWICIPLLRGIGYGMVLMTGIVAVYYNVIMAWTLYYFAMSFSTTLPWSNCDNPWNTDQCYMRFSNNTNTSATQDILQVTAANVSHMDKVIANVSNIARKTPTEEFWERNVLELKDGVEYPGYVRWQLFLCLVGAWTIVFLLSRASNHQGRIFFSQNNQFMYVAATLPYLLLTILLVRGATLDGAWEGFKFYTVPKFEKLASFAVWRDAAVQMFYSAGLGWGGITTLASYNNFNNNVERDAIILPILDCITSWFSGCVIFVNLGHMAHVAGLEIDTVVKQGPGIAFMVYPEALSQLPLPQFWSVLFFLMLFMVGLDSQIVHIQTLTAAITDSFPTVLLKRKLLVTLSVCVTLCLLGISCITQGGIYFLQILDWYCASIAVMFLAFMEMVSLTWVYGINRLYSDVQLMLGRKLHKIWAVFWLFITPVIIAFIWIMNLAQLTPVKYGDVIYPSWAIALGRIIAFVSLVPLPVFMVIEYWRAKGSTFLQRIQYALEPSEDWKPALEEYQEQYKHSRQGTIIVMEEKLTLA